MPLWLLYLLVCLATYRVTRFLTLDEFPLVKYPREWLTAYFDPDEEQTQRFKWAGKQHWGVFGRSIAYLAECPWCASPYVGGVIIAITTRFTSVPLPWLLLIVASATAGLIQSNEPD